MCMLWSYRVLQIWILTVFAKTLRTLHANLVEISWPSAFERSKHLSAASSRRILAQNFPRIQHHIRIAAITIIEHSSFSLESTGELRKDRSSDTESSPLIRAKDPIKLQVKVGGQMCKDGGSGVMCKQVQGLHYK